MNINLGNAFIVADSRVGVDALFTSIKNFRRGMMQCGWTPRDVRSFLKNDSEPAHIYKNLKKHQTVHGIIIEGCDRYDNYAYYMYKGDYGIAYQFNSDEPLSNEEIMAELERKEFIDAHKPVINRPYLMESGETLRWKDVLSSEDLLDDSYFRPRY